MRVGQVRVARHRNRLGPAEGHAQLQGIGVRLADEQIVPPVVAAAPPAAVMMPAPSASAGRRGRGGLRAATRKQGRRPRRRSGWRRSPGWTRRPGRQRTEAARTRRCNGPEQRKTTGKVAWIAAILDRGARRARKNSGRRPRPAFHPRELLREQRPSRGVALASSRRSSTSLRKPWTMSSCAVRLSIPRESR